MEHLEVYDTTLRDGTQGEGVNLSLADKLEIARTLDWLGVDYIEGGWPGSNPKDESFFQEVRGLGLTTSRIAAFGSTRRAKVAAEDDGNLQKLVESKSDLCCIFGKTWDLHVTEALRVSLEDNLAMVADSVRFLREASGRPVFYDAEHFFDGWRANPDYALSTLAAALHAGAERLVLCDTNGGSLPWQVEEAVTVVRRRFPEAALGIHAHNDVACAAANSIIAVKAGCRQVQGTMNGIGERCGNADLTAVIPICALRLGLSCLRLDSLRHLTEVSRIVWERCNLAGPNNQPFVGRSAFAHKGGVHVSAMQRDDRTYEHIRPEAVGNERRILVSELSGRSNIMARLADRYQGLTDQAVVTAALGEIQDRERQGYSYEAADASFELLVRRHLGLFTPAFDLIYYRVHGIGTSARGELVEGTVKLSVGGEQRLCVAEGHGPVDALAQALHLALHPGFPALAGLSLVDYKVRVVNSSDGTAAKVRVLIESGWHHRRFGTMGVSENIIEASWLALVDAIEYVLAESADASRG